MKELRGTGVALVTPFKASGAIDFNALERHISHCIEGGVDYLVVMGTTGENPTLDAAEKKAVLVAALEACNGRVPVVYGLGGNNTRALIDQMKGLDTKGLTALLSVSPYYSKPSQEGLYQHYGELSLASPLPLILYNVPGRTGSNLEAATTLRLARDFENIIGIKEASGNLEQVMDIIADRPEGFLLLSGDDNLTLPILACGGDGVISVSGQAFPAVFSSMVRQGLAGNFGQARQLHYRLFRITQMLFAEGNPGGVKATLDLQGLCEPHLRQPLWPVSNTLRQAIASEMERQQL